ncbi:MAG: LysM peptidoglycan-binding domain-containing protein [Labilithrix sp.]|nr:LysM peptidoglycan-binding domain-containing protein [Labilithrix sp.]MCW5810164.1 LysM peptidoglycan-binding domain-containing protein [Labilithrix sp.]
MKPKHLVVAVAAALLLAPSHAGAFTHVVAQGETLAQLAIRFYGTPRYEAAIVGANRLDAHGGSPIVAGQPLEIPAPMYHRVEQGETWFTLSKTYLGDGKRADVLARANLTMAWTPPVEHREIIVPAVVAHLAGENETLTAISQRYYGDPNKSWTIAIYNGGDEKNPKKIARGDVVLVPLADISLTEEGKKAARAAAERTRTEGGGKPYQAQKQAEADIPPLLADIRSGRYVDAVAKGNKLLGSGELTRPQLATIHRALLEAYVALDAPGAASAACAAWRANVPNGDVRLEPRTVSPKVRAACGQR